MNPAGKVRCIAVAQLYLLRPPRVGALGRPAVLSSLSYTTTLRSLSALMILLFSGLSPERTMLINDGVTPFFFAHFFWLPARLTSKRSKRTASF